MQLVLWTVKAAEGSPPAPPETDMEKWLLQTQCQPFSQFVQIFDRAAQFHVLICPKKEDAQSLEERAKNLGELMARWSKEAAERDTHFASAQAVFAQIDSQMQAAITHDQDRKGVCGSVLKQRIAAKDAVEKHYLYVGRLLQLLLVLQDLSQKLKEEKSCETLDAVQASLKSLNAKKEEYLVFADNLSDLCDKPIDHDLQEQLRPVKKQADHWRKEFVDTYNTSFFLLRRKEWDFVTQEILSSTTPQFRDMAYGLIRLLRDVNISKAKHRTALDREKLNAEIHHSENPNSYENRLNALKRQWFCGDHVVMRYNDAQKAARAQKIKEKENACTFTGSDILTYSSSQRESVMDLIEFNESQRKAELNGLKDLNLFGHNVCTELNRLKGMLSSNATPLLVTQRLAQVLPIRAAQWAGYDVTFVWEFPVETLKPAGSASPKQTKT